MSLENDISPLAENCEEEEEENIPLDDPLPARVYARRWLVLLSFLSVNLANGMLWITYASVADVTATFYHAGGDSFVDVLSLIFPVIIALFGLLFSWLLLRINLKTNMLICAFFNLIGSGLRIVSSAPLTMSGTVRVAVVIAGQAIAGIAQPFIMFSSTALAVDWFAEDQRALANTLGSMGNPLGIMVANLISPVIAKKSSDIFRLNYIYAIPSAMSLLLVLVAVRQAKPPTPPYQHQQQQQELDTGISVAFKDSLRICFFSKSFWLLLFGFSVGVGIYTAISTFIEQILCPWGYSDTFAGISAALLIVGGVVAAGIICSIVDRTGSFNEALKLSFGVATLASLAFFVIMTYRNFQAPILLSVVLYGGFSFTCYPLALELGAEITYPALEVVSSGLLIQGGQIMSVILIMVIQITATDIPSAPYSVCKGVNHPQSFRIPGYILSGLSVFTCIPLILVFRGKYRRRQAEHRVMSHHVNGCETVSS